MAFMNCIFLTVLTSFPLCVNGKPTTNTTQFVYIQGEKGSENWKLICKMFQHPNPIEIDICKEQEDTKLQSSFNAMYSNSDKECVKEKSESYIFTRTKMPAIRKILFGGQCKVFDDEFIIEKIMGEIQTEDIDEKSKSRETAFECTYGMIFLVVFVTSTEIRWLPAYWKLTHKTRDYKDTLAETNVPPYDVEEKYKTL
ncbi:Hypothetical predicted protein [Mytilus galloprovincialis]|uniref:Uncharacterized protein n=1 Tax=Mytilus galloprovincialis TaxID=29158 RepID=A0A8B6GBH9_MYTGA|nr:Hypothetical predicted protein [Mytilus galloprovincialis]